MEKKPVIVAQRLTELREGIHVSQARLAAVFDLDQPASSTLVEELKHVDGVIRVRVIC